jgi:SSS family solute:Na+ symporter
LTFLLYQTGALPNGKGLAATFIQAGVAFTVDIIVSVVLSLTGPEPARDQIDGLVYGTAHAEGGEGVHDEGDSAWFRRPVTLGVGALAIALVLNIVFA